MSESPRKRILFVDDEPKVLEGLKRMLRARRKSWSVTFKESGSAALDAMELESFDVVVTDMRMPEMDGATLLTKIAERYPKTVRIVLTGHADLEASLRAVSVSHQFLTKPCDADLLQEVVDRACGLESLLSDDRLRSTIGGVGQLPILPKTYKALAAVLAEPNVDMHAVERIVERDAAISAKILQLANSSFFRLGRQISSLRQAMAYIGIATIRDVVLSLEVFERLEPGLRAPGYSTDEEQEHCFLTARIARRIVSDPRTAEQAFLAAMLHDIGKLIVATRLPDRFEECLRAGAGVKQPFHVVEERIFGVTHAEIGAYLLGLWGMPYPIVEAVAFHHRPLKTVQESQVNVSDVTYLADLFAREMEGRTLDQYALPSLEDRDRIERLRAIARNEAEARDDAD